jgi:DNA polymerase III epsilon subunit-like protein
MNSLSALARFVSVDVETAGPDPANYPLLSIGACLVGDPAVTFYVELQPDRQAAEPEALVVSCLSLERLAAEGEPPEDALLAWSDWLAQVVPSDLPPVLVAFNAPFDWLFVSTYFHRYLGRNPFGHSALDVKAYAMARLNLPWADTSFPSLAGKLSLPDTLRHHALADAQDQARMLQALMARPATDDTSAQTGKEANP